MVSPQERHPSVSPLSGMGMHSTVRADGLLSDFGMLCSSQTGVSTTELSATGAWRRAAAGDEAYVSLIRTVARTNLRQKTRN